MVSCGIQISKNYYYELDTEVLICGFNLLDLTNDALG
jgi:hypothetical protein